MKSAQDQHSDSEDHTGDNTDDGQKTLYRLEFEQGNAE